MSEQDVRRGATEATRAAHAEVLASLPFEDRRDFEEAARGFVAPLPEGGVIRADDGSVVWDLSRFAFVEQGSDAPETVNPSLWRQSQLIVQRRPLRGRRRALPGPQPPTCRTSRSSKAPKGVIVVDPLISVETARAALDLYYAHRPRRSRSSR